MIRSLCLFFLIFTSATTTANMIRIPFDYATIQEGIDNANEGDTVLVSAGIYFEQLWLNGNNIKLISESGAENTIIDGSLLPQQDSLSLLYIINGEDQQTVIDGFTFRYGRGTYINVYSQERGGAIYCSESSFILKNSILVENTGYEGGAIYYTGSESIIENCEFRLNASEYGGAIYSDFSDLSIISSLFIENDAERQGGGYYGDFSELYCLKTIMYKCSANNGGAIYSDYVNLDFCTIVSNIAHLGAGGGVFCSNGIIHNSILYFNNGGINNNQISPTNSPLIVQYCDVKNGWSGIGNINADPLFAGLISEDFSLTENSPCIDAADPNSLLDPDGTRADMGAVYFNQQQNSAVFPLVLEFPNVNIGSSEVKTFTITNIFDSTLTILNFELNSEVFFTENITPFSIPVGDSTKVNVTFTPLQVQQYNDSLVINANYDLKNLLLNGNGIIEYSGIVNGVWRKSESPIVVIGDIIVPTDDTLEIESGVVVKIMNDKKITINGLLRAIGTAEDSIHFTSFEQTNHWWGLQFINSLNNSVLKYCVIERANPDDNIPNNHNQEENGGGIYCVNSNLAVSNSKIINNRAAPVWSFGEGFGGGVYSNNSNILIDSCETSHNIMSHGGGGVYSLNSEILIKNSVIYDNHAETFAIYGNSSGGGVFVDGGQAQILNNTISFNSNQGYMNSGGGITITDCGDILIENTNITNNSAEVGGGIYFGSGCSGSTVKYSDFHNNLPNNFDGSGIPPGLGIITTTNYNGDPCDAFYNIFLNPLFVNAGNGNFHLQANSPCIDAGDPTFPNDPDSTIADIGRFFFDQSIPVELVSFTAKLVEDIVLLEWITATETNNLGFEIQRKPVNAEWENVGFVQGHGTTTESQSYRYSDNFNSITANSLTYRLKQIDFDGSFKYSDEVLVREASPIEFTLEQNYPNPFNPSTTIKFSIPEATTVTLTIYNVLGERVTELVNSKLAAGRYSFRWNAQNVATGMYIYELRTSNFVSVKKTILIK